MVSEWVSGARNKVTKPAILAYADEGYHAAAIKVAQSFAAGHHDPCIATHATRMRVQGIFCVTGIRTGSTLSAAIHATVIA